MIKKAKIKRTAIPEIQSAFGITYEIAQACKVLIHRHGVEDAELILMKMARAQTRKALDKILYSGVFPVPIELNTKFRDFVEAFIHKAGYSTFDIYNPNIKTEQIFWVRAIMCYHFSVTLGYKDYQTMYMMSYKRVDEILMNIARIENAIRAKDLEFLFFWNTYQTYVNVLLYHTYNKANSDSTFLDPGTSRSTKEAYEFNLEKFRELSDESQKK